MSSMFNGCSYLTSLDLSSFDTSNVADMAHMFHNCSNLTSLDISKFDTSSVTEAQYMFSGCDSLHLKKSDVSNFSSDLVETMGIK